LETWEPSQDSLLDTGKPRKTCVEVKVKESPNRSGVARPEGSRRFRLPDFHDVRYLQVVRSSLWRTGRLYPQECCWYSFSLGVSRPQSHGAGRIKNLSLKNPVTPPGIDAETFRLVAQRLNYYTNPDPALLLW